MYVFLLDTKKKADLDKHLILKSDVTAKSALWFKSYDNIS